MENRAALWACLRSWQIGETVGLTNAVPLRAQVDLVEHHLATDRALAKAFVNHTCRLILNAACTRDLTFSSAAWAGGPFHGAR